MSERKVCAQLLSQVWLFATLWTVAHHDRDFVELCGSHQGCQVPFRPPIPNVGLLLRRCSWNGFILRWRVNHVVFLTCQCKRPKRWGFDPWVTKIPLGGGNGNPLQSSCLGNPTDRGAWWATVHGVTKSQTRLSTQHNLLVYPKRDQSWVFTGRTDAEAETPILWPPDAKSWLFGKDPDAVKDWGQEEKGTTEDEMVGWHHRLDGHGFGWTPGVGDGQGGLGCCGSWGRKESDTTEWPNWTELNTIWVSIYLDINQYNSKKGGKHIF